MQKDIIYYNKESADPNTSLTVGGPIPDHICDESCMKAKEEESRKYEERPAKQRIGAYKLTAINKRRARRKQERQNKKRG